jgi:hypothetical protein
MEKKNQKNSQFSSPKQKKKRKESYRMTNLFDFLYFGICAKLHTKNQKKNRLHRVLAKVEKFDSFIDLILLGDWSKGFEGSLRHGRFDLLD